MSPKLVVVSLCAVAVLAGVLVALVLTGQALNISSYVGAIMMVGIVGENAIFVIHEARLGLRRGLPVADAWREASHRRLRPVAMTILATAFALAPLALAIGSACSLVCIACSTRMGSSRAPLKSTEIGEPGWRHRRSPRPATNLVPPRSAGRQLRF